MNAPVNFTRLANIQELPGGPCSVVSIFVQNEAEARQYAACYPARRVFWLEGEQMGVWFEPLRRTGDLPRYGVN